MTIIFLTRKFYPQIGGVEIHTREVAERLIKKGHSVVVIADNDQINTPDKYKNEVKGVKVIRINTGKETWLKKIRIWKELWKKRELFREADIVHCHDVFIWYFPFRFLFPVKKVYTTFHGYETKYPPQKKAIIVRKISEILSYGNICIGEYIKKWYYTKPDYISYGGVNRVKDQKFYTESAYLKIVLIGRIENDIGIHSYIKSLDMLKKKKIKFNFSAYGEGRMKSQLEKYGTVHNFTENISQAIEKADIVFSSSYLSMLEGIIRKKIIISIYENPLKEEYLKNSPFSDYIYICKDADEISNVITLVQNEPWKSGAMIERGYQWASEQTWEKVTNIYLSLWRI